ncbi:DUF4263 domain-containing protein [Burkholderia multivorans]|uniref:DUF4263 domain-containing protein n=1 Tax=Burkholderia multivorans TaxID=87883 RepID=UPI00207D5B9A|nr:DUF4263 domain-containing protein [Burkholderia multivorans]MCO1451130.1 DUF4263 domain-containing protein [Burkholderia multivorans]
MAFLVQQATARQVFLDQLDGLARDAATTEAVLHKALERNLWVFGAEYSLFSSNSTLRRQVEDVLGKTYTGDKADKRPDLLLNENLGGQYLLIEFKRPSHALKHEVMCRRLVTGTNWRSNLGSRFRFCSSAAVALRIFRRTIVSQMSRLGFWSGHLHRAAADRVAATYSGDMFKLIPMSR